MEERTPLALNREGGFTGIDIPSEADLYRCVHCGLCLSACPTYTELGVETESPRGRIAYMKAVKEGRMGISQRVASHWELCLQCRACEAVCPSGVPFGRIMEYSRSQLRRSGKGSWTRNLAATAFLQGILPRPRILKGGASLLRAYQRWGIRRLLRTIGFFKLLPTSLREVEAGLPDFSPRFFTPSRAIHPAQGPRRSVVGLLSGCVMPLVQGNTMEAAVRVLTRNGCDVVVPVGQGCCGALSRHDGRMEEARKMARVNIDAFTYAGVDKVVVASAGCGSSMKEYGELLKDDPEYRDRAARMEAMTVDITEFLVSLPFHHPEGKIPMKVTFQDPCHLAHAQRIVQAPRTILRAIPGLELSEINDGSRCCGAAGMYSITHRRMSRRLLDSKMNYIDATGAEAVVTANPGCMIQLESGIRDRGSSRQVYHIVDILDESYRREAASVPE